MKKRRSLCSAVEAKISDVSLELEKVSGAVSAQIDKQNDMLKHLESMEKSKDVDADSMRNLNDLKSQMEKWGKNGAHLMQDILRLDLEFNRLHYAAMEYTCKKLLENRSWGLEQQKKKEPPRMINLFESAELHQIMAFSAASEKRVKEHSCLKEVRNKMSAHLKKNIDALNKIEKVREEMMSRSNPLDLHVRLQKHYDDPVAVPNPIQKDMDQVSEYIRCFQRDLAQMGAVDGSDGGQDGTDAVTKDSVARIRDMRHELDDAIRSHQGLKRKQEAMQKEIDGLEANDEGIIVKLGALKTQFEELNSVTADLKKNFGGLCVKILQELHISMGEVGQVEQSIRQKRNKPPGENCRALPIDIVNRIYMQKKMEEISKLNVMACEELSKLGKIAKKNAVALTQIEMMKRCVNSSVQDPECCIM